jgi:hypothetical protein
MMTIAAAPARAQEASLPATETQENSSIDQVQVLYRGVVGNILEAVPLPAEQRVQLQRGNAVISNTFAGRSVAVLLGLASPILMIGGLIWGIWSAANIKATSMAHAATVPTGGVPQPPQATPTVEAAELVPAEADAQTDPARLARTE